MCLQFNPGISHSSFLSLELEPGHCVVDIMSRGSPVHLPPCGVTRDRSYVCIEMSSLTMLLYCGISVIHVHVIPKRERIGHLLCRECSKVYLCPCF